MSQPADRHLFLSPHYDDTSLSCGGTVALLTSRGHRPEIALMFGDSPDPEASLTPFARYLHREWGMEAGQVIDGRRAEEAAAAARIGASDVYLPFRDAIYRSSAYDSNDAIFGQPVALDANLPATIVDSLERTFDLPHNAFIYAPLAIGEHVDHQIGFLTGMLLHNAGYTVRFYEDLPYALSREKFERRMDAIGGTVETAESVAIGEVWETKIDAIMAFPSQLKVIFESYVGVDATRASISEALRSYAEAIGHGVPVERFWKASGVS
ncbi:MAG: PIG-L deacetylase family protein [Thermomicrobiales bacterium]